MPFLPQHEKEKAIFRISNYKTTKLNLSNKEKEKTLIHELLHIPKGFSGGFRSHKGYVDRRRVERLHQVLLKRRSLKSEV